MRRIKTMKMIDLVNALSVDYEDEYKKELNAHPDMVNRRRLVAGQMADDNHTSIEEAIEDYDGKMVEEMRMESFRRLVFPADSMNDLRQ
jgi:hypothetical protein